MPSLAPFEGGRSDLLNAPVEEIMTTRPKTVQPDQLVSKALELLNFMKITALFVVENGRLVEIIHIRGLLQAGVA